MENNQPASRTGRPRSKAPTEPLKLRLDAATSMMLEELRAYGRFGTTKQEIVMFIVRSWLWEHEARLKTGIASKDRPFGPAHGEPE